MNELSRKINSLSIKNVIISLFAVSIFIAPSAAFAKLPGKYEVIVPFMEPATHSADVVTIHEIFAFDCSHCYHYFQEGTLKKLKKKYGKKLEIHYIPIGWRGPDPGRLYYIADENEKGEEVIGMIFDFIFNKGLGGEMFSRDKLQFVARMSGLKREFDSRMDDPAIVKRMNEGIAYAEYRRIDSTPAIVVQGVLMANRGYGNLETIIDSLLK